MFFYLLRNVRLFIMINDLLDYSVSEYVVNDIFFLFDCLLSIIYFTQ